MTEEATTSTDQEALLFDGWGFVPLKKRKDSGKQSKQVPPAIRTIP